MESRRSRNRARRERRLPGPRTCDGGGWFEDRCSRLKGFDGSAEGAGGSRAVAGYEGSFRALRNRAGKRRCWPNGHIGDPERVRQPSGASFRQRRGCPPDGTLRSPARMSMGEDAPRKILLAKQRTQAEAGPEARSGVGRVATLLRGRASARARRTGLNASGANRIRSRRLRRESVDPLARCLRAKEGGTPPHRAPDSTIRFHLAST